MLLSQENVSQLLETTLKFYKLFHSSYSSNSTSGDFFIFAHLKIIVGEKKLNVDKTSKPKSIVRLKTYRTINTKIKILGSLHSTIGLARHLPLTVEIFERYSSFD